MRTNMLEVLIANKDFEAIGKNVVIVGGKGLAALGLEALAGKEGCISHIEARGCWVVMSEPYLGESEWFVFFSSIQVVY